MRKATTGELVLIQSIDWGFDDNSSPPLNEPPCGYTEDRGPCCKMR